MRVKILLQITTDDGAPGDVEEIASFGKGVERAEDLGLSHAESKTMLAAAQLRIVEAQTKGWTEGRRCCEVCGRRNRSKGDYPIVFRTLFGDVRLASPRFRCCPCREGSGSATASPLVELIPDHVAPERLYLETRWASLVPYAPAAELLADVLPIAAGVNATTVRRQVLRVAERIEADLPKNKCSFAEGSPLDWEALPIPDGRIVVGLDGGYVRDWTERKTNFEVCWCTNRQPCGMRRSLEQAIMDLPPAPGTMICRCRASITSNPPAQDLERPVPGGELAGVRGRAARPRQPDGVGDGRGDRGVASGEEPAVRGGQLTIRTLAIETGVMLRLAFARPWRQTEGLLRSATTLLGS